MDNFDVDGEKPPLMTPEWWIRAANMREAVKTMYEEKRKRAAMLTWIGTAVGVGLMFMGIAALIIGVLIDYTTVAVVGAMMFLFGDGWITGSKLLYWTWHTRLQLQRDLKEVHYDVLNLHEKLDRLEAAIAGKSAPEG